MSDEYKFMGKNDIIIQPNMFARDWSCVTPKHDGISIQPDTTVISSTNN